MNGNNRRVRGQILFLLYESGPDGLSLEGLEGTLRNAGKYEEARRTGEYVAYLQDRGYVRTEEIRDPISGIRRDVVIITARGTDLVEGTIDADPGVICVR